jgi:hypothetical protein
LRSFFMFIFVLDILLTHVFLVCVSSIVNRFTKRQSRLKESYCTSRLHFRLGDQQQQQQLLQDAGYVCHHEHEHERRRDCHGHGESVGVWGGETRETVITRPRSVHNAANISVGLLGYRKGYRHYASSDTVGHIIGRS